MKQASSTSNSVSGVQRWRNEIMGGFVALTCVYAVAYRVADTSRGSSSLAFRPAEQYCHNQQEVTMCSRPDLFAFQVAGFVSQVFLATNGVLGFHFGQKPSSSEARLFGYLPSADRMNAGILVYQLWDFVFSLSIPEHATAVFLSHHLAAALTAYYSLEYQMCHYYSNFFGGCSELSTLFLVFCDFDVYFPSANDKGSPWSMFIFACQACFVLTFLAYRVVGWWGVSYGLWKDALFVLRQRQPSDSHKKTDNGNGADASITSRSGNKIRFLYVFLFMDVALGLLQVYWFAFGMLPKIMEILKA